ncbi:hypothetical protein P7K49_011498 [Saguinus oedipus]|uniref:SH3 domain-containing protein n=1 Tax=Saguinus oedipus TaxID=9490 RepID=A0ABQ9VQT7_SAGOE|nr:hypothetical protein P7K49_011498 [Saguinus oedipus]
MEKEKVIAKNLKHIVKQPGKAATLPKVSAKVFAAPHRDSGPCDRRSTEEVHDSLETINSNRKPLEADPFRVSSQGMKSGKDSQILGPVGALIKLPGSHSRIHMVSETVPSSLHFCLLFCFEGQRVDFTHFSSHHCVEASTSAVGRVSVPLKQEQTDWEPGSCRCPAEPHLLPCLHPLRVGREHFPKASSILLALQLKRGATKCESKIGALNNPRGANAFSCPLQVMQVEDHTSHISAKFSNQEYNMYGWWVGELNSLVGIVPKEYLTAAFEVEER